MNRANLLVSDFGETLKQHYGFVADVSKPLWQNIDQAMESLSMQEYCSRPSNMACHNYLSFNPLPSGTRDLLGLGLNYCIVPHHIETTNHTFDRFRQDARRIYTMSQAEPEENDPNQYGPDYIPSLYIKSDYPWKPVTDDIEDAINSFQAAIEAAQHQLSQRRSFKPNLSHSQWTLLEYLRRHDMYIVVEADKNLGPCILDRIIYIRRGCSEHLGNESNYKIISEQEARTLMRGIYYRFGSWMKRFYWDQYFARQDGEQFDGPVGISDAESDFLSRAVKRNEFKLAKFRMTMKVHKTPWKMRPIVCCSGTFMNDWSRWLDYQLQKCKPFIDTYLRDSQQVLDDVRALKIPTNAWFFTADANAMYNNIDTEHAILVIGEWLDELAPQIGADFPLEAIKEAMALIMRNNIFGWGSLHFLQLLGTAMGTSAAVMWATLYYGYHEKHTLIPKYGRHLLYFKRFIDDIIGIWLLDESSAWEDFQADVNDFGILTWEIEELSKSVNFLDLTLTIVGDRIETKTFQKLMNLYLYLTPASAHPIGVIKGTIFGLLSRYFAQNTHREDYIYFVTLLYRRLLRRNWQIEDIYPIFLEAAERIEAKSRETSQATTSKDGKLDNTMFIHLQYHPHDIPRRTIRQLFEEHCSEPFRASMGIERAMIAYSRLKNIGEYVTQAKLHEPPGQSSDIIMGEYKAGLDPP